MSDPTLAQHLIDLLRQAEMQRVYGVAARLFLAHGIEAPDTTFDGRAWRRRSSPSPRRRHDRNHRSARYSVRVTGIGLQNQHPTAPRPRGRGAQRDDRRNRRTPAAVERRSALLAAARSGQQWRYRSGHRHRSRTRYRCLCRATSSGSASRWSWAPPPATNDSPATRTSPMLSAARCWPCLSRAAAPCTRCSCWKPLIRGAFTAQRLDGVKLIAGRLAVTLDNAQLTTSPARIVAAGHARRRIERDLHDGAQQRLGSSTLRLRTARAACRQGRRAGVELDELAAEATEPWTSLRNRARHPPSGPGSRAVFVRP
jgi:hypothetical protein